MPPVAVRILHPLPDPSAGPLVRWVTEGRATLAQRHRRGFEAGKEVAFLLKEVLDALSLKSFVKTSGKTGLHVFVPIKRTIDFDAARHVSELVGRHLQRLHPKDITLEWSIPKRTGRIFMDYNMNVRGKTLNVAYSPRGAPGAAFAWPQVVFPWAVREGRAA